ncbi:MAG: hypothetical protein ABSF91_11405 [Bacteroidota bacterium]|jgi:hypothetical protein
MKKQTFSAVISYVVILSSLVLIYMNATAQAIRPSDKAVESFVPKMEQGKDSAKEHGRQGRILFRLQATEFSQTRYMLLLK